MARSEPADHDGEASIQPLLDQERAHRQTLEARLNDAETARQDMEQRLAYETASTEARFAELQAQYDVDVTEGAATQKLLEEKIAGQLAEFTASLAQMTRDRDTLAQELRDAVAAFELARRQWTAESVAANEHRARRESELEAQVQHEAATRIALEEKLAGAAAALRDAQERHTVELRMAAAEFADRQAQFDAALAEAAAARQALEQQVRIGTAALERAHQDRAAEAAAAADTLRERESELGNALGEAVSIRSALEDRLTVPGGRPASHRRPRVE